MYDGENLNYDFDYNTDETNALNELLNGNTEVDACSIRRIALWKLDRVVSIPDELIADLRDLAGDEALTIDDPQVIRILDSLVNCDGVWYPMASSFFKFLRPDIFPIIDVRAYRALTDKKLYRGAYNGDLYIEYTHALMAIAEEQNLELWEVDQQLYCFDLENNGRI